MNIQKFIEGLKEEIGLLEEDKSRINNKVSVSSLQLSIDNRKDRIEELTKKYLSE